jgi:hypothetical protein
MKRTRTEVSVSRTAAQAHVPDFRMQGAPVRAASDRQTPADAGSHGNVSHSMQAASGTAALLRKCGRINVGINHERHRKAIGKGGTQVKP